jgi:hypothetical protein
MDPETWKEDPGNHNLSVSSLSWSPRVKVSDGLQLDLEVCTSNDLDSVTYVTMLQHSKHQKYVRNLLNCCKFHRKDACPEHHYFGGDCEHEKNTICRCGSRYCQEDLCVSSRWAKSLRRLNSFKVFPLGAVSKWKQLYNGFSLTYSKSAISRIKQRFFSGVKSYECPRRLYHFTIGSSYMDSEQLRLCVRNYFRRMRYKGYKMHYFKVFDIGKKSFDKTGLYYLHYHIALIPEFNDSKVYRFMETSKNILSDIEPLAVFNNIGFRSVKNIFSYFSKRNAGILGHKKSGYYYYQNLMDLSSYLQNFYNKKLLTYHLPEWLVYNPGPSCTNFYCPIHEKPLQFVILQRVDPSETFELINFQNTKTKLRPCQ